MATDFELDAMLEIDDSQVDDVNDDLEANVTGGGGGDMSPAERDKQESVVAGGVSKGLLAAGVIAGILSQLKSVTGFIAALLGMVSRFLVPAIEKLADFIRPYIRGVNKALSAPDEVTSKVESKQESIGGGGLATGVPGTLSPSGLDTLSDIIEGRESVSLDSIAEIFFGPKSSGADQSGEVTKAKVRQYLLAAQDDKLGGTT